MTGISWRALVRATAHGSDGVTTQNTLEDERRL